MVHIPCHQPTQVENNLRGKIKAFSEYTKCLRTFAHFIEKKGISQNNLFNCL